MKKILILTCADYEVNGNKGTTFTFLNEKMQLSKQSATPELSAEIKKSALPAYFDIVDFEIGVKKGLNNTTNTSFTVTALKFVKEAKLFN